MRAKSKRPRKTIELIRSYGIDPEAVIRLGEINRGEVEIPRKAASTLTFFLAARSATERKWRETGRVLVEKLFENVVCFAGYEWMGFKLPGGSYTPDWCYLLEDGRWIHIEVKASRFQRSYRDARSKLRAAASLNPWFTFCEARPEEAGWVLEIIAPESEYAMLLLGQIEK